jgi:hypothetical protein
LLAIVCPAFLLAFVVRGIFVAPAFAREPLRSNARPHLCLCAVTRVFRDDARRCARDRLLRVAPKRKFAPERKFAPKWKIQFGHADHSRRDEYSTESRLSRGTDFNCQCHRTEKKTNSKSMPIYRTEKANSDPTSEL